MVGVAYLVHRLLVIDSRIGHGHVSVIQDVLHCMGGSNIRIFRKQRDDTNRRRKGKRIRTEEIIREQQHNSRIKMIGEA